MRRLRFVNLLRFWSAALAVLEFFGHASGADDGKRGFVEKVFKDDAGEHRYAVFVPVAYSPSKIWPVMLFLHGAGERGSDGRAHLNVGLGPLVKARETNFPAIVVFPQCENTHGRALEGWLAGSADANRALRILEQVEKDYRIDPKRRILTGWSMGGFGAWSLAAADPARWSCLVPIAGGGQAAWAEKLKDVPIWAWHGDDDHAIVANRSREMIDALKAAGGTPRYTEIPSGDHDSWKIAYADDRLIAWMLDPTKVDPDKLPAPKERLPPKLVFAQPFVPALEIPNAMYARLGNQMLEAVAYAAPQQIPQDMLSGRIKDLFDSTNVEGYGFSIRFSGITYKSQLNQIRIKAHAKDRLNIQV
ncbi:MAG TPA: alpha/beta hydrolase-fold protein, partial [Planctomycetaceae bacterium]|nr:alpha/beta hydrolase-fold protein [Planctomycetaceae bacterium]